VENPCFAAERRHILYSRKPKDAALERPEALKKGIAPVRGQSEGGEKSSSRFVFFASRAAFVARGSLPVNSRAAFLPEVARPGRVSRVSRVDRASQPRLPALFPLFHNRLPGSTEKARILSFFSLLPAVLLPEVAPR
jgi:hypothetical protein